MKISSFVKGARHCRRVEEYGLGRSRRLARNCRFLEAWAAKTGLRRRGGGSGKSSAHYNRRFCSSAMFGSPPGVGNTGNFESTVCASSFFCQTTIRREGSPVAPEGCRIHCSFLAQMVRGMFEGAAKCSLQLQRPLQRSTGISDQSGDRRILLVICIPHHIQSTPLSLPVSKATFSTTQPCTL